MVETRTTEINGRWLLELPLHRAERPEWPWWEAERLAAMHHVISRAAAELGRQDPAQRPLVLDVGAEEGDFPALWSSWGADVILAEPNPAVWPNIAAIWQANGLVDPLGCWCGFVGDGLWAGEDPPEEAFTMGGRWPLSAAGPVIGDHGFCQLGERPDLPQTTADNLIGMLELGLGRPLLVDVITMDVEGAELQVLQGAAGLLEHHAPDVFVSIHPEFMAHHYGLDDGVERVRAFMAEVGYPRDRHQFLAIDHEHHWWFQR